MTRTEIITLEEERICFYYEMGLAISEWSNVENALRYLVLACFENKDEEDLTHRSLSVGFLSVETAKARIDFAEGVVKRRFEAYVKDWATLVKRTRGASGLRNKLAHWPVREHPDSPPGRRVLLVPWVYDRHVHSRRMTRSKNPNIPVSEAQGLRDVVKMKLAFIAVRNALQNFCDRVSGVQERHAKSLEQPARLPEIGRLRAQNLAALVARLKSSEQRS